MKKYNNKIKVEIVAAAMSAAMALTSCAQAAEKTTNSTSETFSVPSETITVGSTTETTTVETEYTGLSVETQNKEENPFGDFVLDESYNTVTYYIIVRDNLPDAMCGFDNPASIAKLQDEVYNVTGVTNTNLTLSDVNYFQFNPLLKDFIGGAKGFSEQEDFTMFNCYSIESIRAILSSLGLRFGIDEIPADYLMERFPRLYYDYLNTRDFSSFMNGENVTITDVESIGNLTEVSDPNYLDYLLFLSCLTYNFARLDCVYDNPYGSGCITQVRDAATGRNVLVPTDSEALAMQEDINKLPGCENLSIYVSETPEEFYNSYGYYPNDLVQNIAPANTKEAFEAYVNSLPESEQNQLYIDAINACLADPQKGSSKSR